MKGKSTTELNKIIADKREELRAQRFSIAGSANRNVKHQKNTKKDIARALTELRAQAGQSASTK